MFIVGSSSLQTLHRISRVEAGLMVNAAIFMRINLLYLFGLSLSTDEYVKVSSIYIPIQCLNFTHHM